MSRTQARELIFKLIYEYGFLNKYNEISLNSYTENGELDDSDKQFITKSYNEIIENYDNIYDIIKNNLERYTMEKVTKMDLAILMVATYELKFTQEVSEKVAINEAVELAKKYSNDNSYKFVNGVLARIVASGVNDE